MNVITRLPTPCGRGRPRAVHPIWTNCANRRVVSESGRSRDQARHGRRFAGVSQCNPAGRRAIGVADRLFGLETEYAFSALGPRGARVDQGRALSRLMDLAREHLPCLPDRSSSGIFLQNGSRLYLDCGGHPELATPENGQSLGCLPLRAGRRSDPQSRSPTGCPPGKTASST